MKYIKILLIFLFPALVFATPSSRITPGLIGLWHFDEGTGTSIQDYSSTKAHGEVAGITWSNASGKYGFNAYFVNIDYGTIPDNAAWDFAGNNFTVCWWEKRTGEGLGLCPIARSNDIYAPWLLGFDMGSHVIVAWIDALGGGEWDIANNQPIGTIVLNKWIFRAVVRNGSNFYAYENDGLYSAWTSALAIKDEDEQMYLGYVQGTYYWAGYLDELAIYNRALSAGELKNLYYNWKVKNGTH